MAGAWLQSGGTQAVRLAAQARAELLLGDVSGHRHQQVEIQRHLTTATDGQRSADRYRALWQLTQQARQSYRTEPGTGTPLAATTTRRLTADCKP